jgi:VCBS repeat-containing protein
VFRDPSNVPSEGLVVGSVQMPAASPLEAIGKIGPAIGSVTIMRADGVLVRPGVGDLVYRGDTIETEADGAVGITFADGTAFNLSAAARLVLNDFVCDPVGTPNSALFSLVQGAFSFVAGKIARTGGLRIDTPFATIRGTAQDRGIGILTLAALTFAAIKESEAASHHDAFLDDGTITYKDLAHGTFEIVTRDGRVIVADDPGETIVVDPTGSVARLPNSASRMAELQQAQQTALATLSLGQQQGAAPDGSSTQQFDIPVQLHPINFAPPSFNGPTPEAVTTTHLTAVSPGVIEVPELKQPLVTIVTPVLAPDGGMHPAIEAINTTGSTHVDTVPSGTLTFTDLKVSTVSASLASMTWSGGATLPSGLGEVLAGALSITTEGADSGFGSIATTFSAPDRTFDFLAANEALAIVYNVTVTGSGGVSLTQPVTIAVTGSNDAPALAADASGPHTVTQGLITTGTLTFTDVDLNDHHTVSTSVNSATWSGGATLPSGLAAVLAGALSTTVSDATGSGSIAFAFSAGDSAFDFLNASQTLTITYEVTVTDNNGVSSTQSVTVTITGTNDAPVATITPTTYSAAEQISLNLKNSMSVSDVDSLGGVETATLAVTEGTLTVAAGTSGAVVSGSGTNTVTVTGALAQINALLNTDATSTVSYIDATDTPSASATLTLSINDNGLGGGTALTGSDTAIINIGSVNDAPVLDAHSGSLSYTENQAATALDTAITVSDVDSANLAGATVQITSNFVSGQDVLGFTNQNGIAGSYNAVTGVLMLAGQASLAQYQAALESVTYFNSSDNPSGQTRTISYQVNDGSAQNNLSNVVTATVAVTPVNDAPVITSGVAAAQVSEEGLTNGVPDTLPASLDTTNSTSASGTMTAADVDGDALTMSLGTPSALLTSGGVAIAWTLQDAGHTLIGKAGTATIITATITDAGTYNVALNGPIDHSTANQEDNTTFTVPVIVSDGHTTTPTTLSVTIEDDSPNAEPVEVSVVATDSKTNVMLILDLSGSMDTDSGLTGLTRLDVAKAAINELLDQYDNRGDVMVRIVTFSDTGAAVGSAWQSVVDAKAAIAGLSAGGNTNYDAALLTAMGAFTDGSTLAGPGTQNVSYFLSDGDPTASSDWPQIPDTQLANGIQANEQAVWESFLTTNKIVSFGLGIPNVGTPANLDPIAFDPASGAQPADTPIIVTDLSQLANALVFTIPPFPGSVLTGAGGATSNSFGADGGFVQSITVDSVTYTFNPAANGGAGGITTSGGGSFTYDGTTKTLTVDTDTNVVGGELAMVMTTGAFTFQPPTGLSSKSVGFVLVDRDGDTASSTIHFSAAGGLDHPPIVRDDHVITNVSGGSGTNIVIPDYALLYNDSDADGQTIAITGAITNVLGATSVTHASGNVTFTDTNTNGGSFTYAGSTTSPGASDTGDVTIDRSQTGTTLTGTGFGEIFIGRDGTNNTINANEGNDVLIGGTGNDSLTGGAGADMMTGGGGADTFIINSAQSPGTVGGSGDAGTISGYDVITDFATATDILNLQGTAAPATGTNVSGTDSSLTINGQTIKSHTISNGIIAFDDANTFGSPLTLSSTADVAAAVDYLHRNNLGNAGATVAFVANIGGTAHSYVFEQVGNSPNAANDILVDLAGVTLSNLTALIPSHIFPAGVSGSPMNLGLTDPAGDVGSVTVAIAGVPSGWTLSEGTNNGDGSWTIQASCVSMLSITSPANYAGAMALQVTMTWTNADGSNGFARATDNVEVFAQGAPIFAWSGEDHLTGSSGKDLFVFAQPIGHDTIYSFNAGEDQIDLIGYWGFTNFNDVQHHLSEDSASNAVITLANGQSITLLDVPGSSLSANNFVFDHTPALINTGTLTISDGALLPLSGIITNTGTIALDSTGNEAHLELIQNGIALQGGGQVVLSDSDENLISGTAPSVTVTNIDNTISGAGQLGTGQMALINNGTIAAIGTHALVVDTGTNVLTNAGTLEATGSGGLIVNSDVANSGLIWANGGNITINGAVTGSGSAMISGAATLEWGAESSANVTFGADAAGTLILRDPTGFTGTISGLSSTDHIDLANMSYETASVYGITYSSNTNITTLVITGGTNTDTISLLGNYTINTAWHLSGDGHGGTIVSEAPASPTSELISVQSTSADNNLPRGPFTDVNETANAASDIHVAAAEQSLPNSTALAARAHSDDSTVQAAANINDQFHFAYANPGTLDSPQLLSQAASHAAAEIPLVTANSVISLPHNFTPSALPAPADNLAPQAAKNPSLLSGTGSRDDLFQILDDILTDAAQAPHNTVTALDQNHDVAWMNAHHDKPSNDFIIHA